MPASATLGEDASDFQYNFLKSGGLPLVLSMLTRNNFLPSADMETRRGAYLNALKIAKLLLTAVGFGHVKAVAEACQPNAEGTIPVSPVSWLDAHKRVHTETCTLTHRNACMPSRTRIVMAMLMLTSSLPFFRSTRPLMTKPWSSRVPCRTSPTLPQSVCSAM